MNFGEILDIVWTILAIIAFIGIIIFTIKDIKKSNKYWDDMFAHLEVFKTSMKKEHDLLKKVQAFDAWLGEYCGIMHTNASLEDNEFNNGVANAANDIQESFLKYLGKYVDGKESSD